MAQLSDDCFAFGGPLMSVDEAVGIITARVTAVQEIETVPLGRGRWTHSRKRHFSAPAAAAIHQFRCRRLCRAGRDLPREGERPFPSPGAFRPAPRSKRRRSRVTRCGFSPARRCRTAPIRCSCRKTCGSTRDGRVVLPAGLKPGANVRPAGEDVPLAFGAAAGQRLRPQDVGAGGRFRPHPGRRDEAHPRRGVLDRRRTGLARSAARSRATVRFQPLHADGDAQAARLRGQRPRDFAR